jgi:hypothetical protein
MCFMLDELDDDGRWCLFDLSFVVVVDAHPIPLIRPWTHRLPCREYHVTNAGIESLSGT